MMASLLHFDQVLSEDTVDIRLCDTFQQGIYDPQSKRIVLCANALYQNGMFDFALKRLLIQYYDHARSDNYNFSSCKHLACTEVRAAVLHPLCDPFISGSLLNGQGDSREGDVCVKKKATEFLEERPFCRVKAKEYVEYSYHKCVGDQAPYGVRGGVKMESPDKIQ